MEEKKHTLVMKFGGTSVGTADAMRQTAEIIRQGKQSWSRLVVVISALSGVTNLLLDSATHAARGDPSTLYSAEGMLRQMHHAIAEALIPDLARRAQVKQEIGHLVAEFTHLCQAITVLGEYRVVVEQHCRAVTFYAVRSHRFHSTVGVGTGHFTQELQSCAA